MISELSNRITDEIYANLPDLVDPAQRERIEYGAYMAISEISKVTLLLLIACILQIFNLHIFVYILGVILIFGFLRMNIGGIHSKTHWGCLISYFITVYGTLALSFILKNNVIIFDVVIIPFALIVTYLYAPADMPVKPIISKRQMKRLRITGFILLGILFTTAQFLDQVWFNIIMLTCFITTILMTPPVYKLTKNKYSREEVVL